MKKALLCCALLMGSASFSFAQIKETLITPKASDNGAPAVLLGTIATSTASREQVLAYPRLLPQQLDCEVTGFTFSITSGDKAWGPVSAKGPKLNEEMKDKIKEWDAGKIRISIDNIRLKCGGHDATANSITIEYDH